MSAEPLFAYGTLHDGDILAGVLGRTLAPTAIRPASASGYRAVYCLGQVYPVLAIAPAGTVVGQLLDGLTPAELAILECLLKGRSTTGRRFRFPPTPNAKPPGPICRPRQLWQRQRLGRWSTGPCITARSAGART